MLGGINIKLNELFNRFFYGRFKQLPSGNTVESSIIPIKYKDKNDFVIANYIKEEINKYSGLYKIFLGEYDAICIGDVVTEKNNILRIDPNFDKSMFRNEKKLKGWLKDPSIELLDNILDLKYRDKFPGFYMAILKENVKHNPYVSIFGSSQINDLHYNIAVYNEDDRLYLNYLSSLKDMDGLKLLVESKDVRDFLVKYNEKNALKLLNWAVESFTDHTYDDFFLKNLNIIDEAIQYTKHDAQDYIDAALKGEEKDIVLPNRNNLKSCNENNISMSKTDMVLLTKKILDSFDTSGKLGNKFEKNIMEGKIFLFYPEEKSQAADTLSYLWGVKENKNDLVNKPYYNSTCDLCVIPLTSNVSDIPIIIHEYIHQYYYNNTKHENPYSLEIPSIFFERESIRYLEENGYRQEANILEKEFEYRKKNDSLNNYAGLRNYVHLNKIKKNGEITFENCLDDDLEVLLKQQIKNNPNVTNKEVVKAKNRIVQLKLKEFMLILKEEGMHNVQRLISYTIGTLIAEKYNESNFIKTGMLELINNPEYSIQDILNGIDKDKKEDTFIKNNKNIVEREI